MRDVGGVSVRPFLKRVAFLIPSPRDRVVPLVHQFADVFLDVVGVLRGMDRLFAREAEHQRRKAQIVLRRSRLRIGTVAVGSEVRSRIVDDGNAGADGVGCNLFIAVASPLRLAGLCRDQVDIAGRRRAVHRLEKMIEEREVMSVHPEIRDRVAVLECHRQEADALRAARASRPWQAGRTPRCSRRGPSAHRRSW